jgi:PmbA protein
MHTLPALDSGPFVQDSSTLYEIAASLIAAALSRGATDAVVNVSEAEGVSVTVRGGEIDEIEHARSGGATITVYFAGRRATVSTSVLSSASLQQAVAEACRVARWTARDTCHGPAEEELLETAPRDLDLYYPWQPSVQEAAQWAREIERAALATADEIVDSHACVFASQQQFLLMTSRGFAGGYASSRHQVSGGVIASRDGHMQAGGWSDVQRRPSDLIGASALGRKAAGRTLAMLGARQLSTRQCPVLFEAQIAGSLIEALVNAVSGGPQYTGQTFLPQALGERVLADHLSLDEDPYLLRGRASAPFDSEGVRTSRRTVVEGGVLQGLFLDCHSARRLNLRSTGHAGGAHNLSLTSRNTRPEDTFGSMLKLLDTGLLVTKTMGQGLDCVTGDYSVGVAGFWIERAQVQYPVQGITIAGNLKEMLRNIVLVGADTHDDSLVATGSILVDHMTVAGR